MSVFANLCRAVESAAMGVAAMAIVFTASAATFKTLYAFTDGSDGKNPAAGLVFSNGFLYGTTPAGGAHHKGSVFRLNPVTGRLTTLHAFSGPDDETPVAGLVADWFGSLYGTTSEGGGLEGALWNDIQDRTSRKADYASPILRGRRRGFKSRFSLEGGALRHVFFLSSSWVGI